MLRELQRDFAARVRRRAPELAVYHGSWIGMRVEALADLYPVCRELVGDAFFDAMAKRFVELTPSTSPDLNRYGEDLGDFISGFAPAREVPYLADVARLEWRCHQAFHAADAAPLDPEALASIAAERHGDLRFALAPSLSTLTSAHPVARIWSLHQRPDAAGERIDLDTAAPARCVVWRDGLEVCVEDVVDDDAWALLDAFARRLRLAEAIESMRHPEALGALLQNFLASGRVVGFSV